MTSCSGPMSFVEYESTDFATRALHELYGHTLGGLVKGGIRLSYSKNPLVSIASLVYTSAPTSDQSSKQGVRSNSVSTLGGQLSPPLNNAYGYNPQPDPFTSHQRRFTDGSSDDHQLGVRSTTSPAPYDSRPFSPFSGPGDPGNGY